MHSLFTGCHTVSVHKFYNETFSLKWTLIPEVFMYNWRGKLHYKCCDTHKHRLEMDVNSKSVITLLMHKH